jgi:hypothetical protein
MRRGVANLIFAVIYSAGYGLGVWLISDHAPNNTPAAWVAAYALLFIAAMLFGIVAHELGHAVAVRLSGGQVLTIHFFGPPDRLTFHIGQTAVTFGLRPRGRVEFPRGQLSIVRDGLVTAAGPLAEMLTAPLWLLLPLPRWISVYLAFISLTSGLRDFAPGTDEYESDGYKLFRFRAQLRAEADIRELLATPDWSAVPEAADRLINGYRLEVPQAEDCVRQLSAQPAVLRRLYALQWTLPKQPARDVRRAVHSLSWAVLLAPDLPSTLADLAANRVEWVLRTVDPHEGTQMSVARVKHTLALARLRQGRAGDVRALCRNALAESLGPSERATVLATVAMAKHARMLSGNEELDEALALDPNADLVAEAVGLLRGKESASDAGKPEKAPRPDEKPEVALSAL